MSQNEKEDLEQNNEVSPRETMFIFLGVLGLIPWAFIWVLFLAPNFGLGNVSLKLNLIFVLGIYAGAWVLIARTKRTS